MRFRVYATHAVEGTVLLSEPEGLKYAIISLKRHPELHSLVKEFNTVFRTYGSNGTQDGRRDWLKNIETTYGPDEVITELIEYAPDNFNFRELFSGEFAIQSFIEDLNFDHGLEYAGTPNGFWRRTMSRFDVPVDVQSATNLDGDAVTVYTPENVLLPSQKIRFTYNAFLDKFKQFFDDDIPVSTNIQLSMSRIIRDDILDVFSIETSQISGRVIWFFEPEYAGSYDFDLRIESWARDITGIITLASSPYVHWYFQVNDDAPILLTETDFGSAPYESTVYTYLATHTLEAKDVVRVYGTVYSSLTPIGGTQTYFIVSSQTATAPSGAGGESDPPTYFRIIGDTTFPDSETNGFLLHDLIAAALDRISDSDLFYSEVLGSPYTRARIYAESGCYWNNVALKGLLIRGYTLTEKQFAISMKDIWEGINPLINLSIGYEKHPDTGADIIRLEEKAYCYDSSSMSVLLSGVQKIKRKYSDQYFNSVETGNAKGKIEDISGIDDPQKQVRANIFKNIGRKLTLVSTWITQSLTIEWTRRSTKLKSADNKFDNETFIIEVTKDGSDYTPRLNEDYDSVTDLLNESTRYNKRWTPARTFLRWSNYIFMGCQNYVGTVYRFVSGEGNYDMSSGRKPDDCSDNYGGAVLDEGGDIPITDDHLYIPQEFEIEHYLTQEEFDTIDANRNKAIGISQFAESLGGHAEFFITDLQLEIMSGQIKLTGFFKDPFNIQTVAQGGTITQGGKIFDATFDFTFE